MVALIPYLQFEGNCEEAFNFYSDVFGGGDLRIVHADKNPNSPVMHASINFALFDGSLMGSDVDNEVVVSGMSLCCVLPNKEVIESVCAKLSVGGTLVRPFELYAPPHDDEGGAEVIDRYGYTWYLNI